MTSNDPGKIGIAAELKLLTYRLDSMENKRDEYLDKMDSKLDKLLEKVSELSEGRKVDAEKISTNKSEVESLNKRLTKLEAKVVNVQITMAEKLAYGGLGGGIVAIIIEIFKGSSS